MCRSMVDIQSATAEIRRGKKKEKKKEKKHDENIYVRILLCREAIKYVRADGFCDNIIGNSKNTEKMTGKDALMKEKLPQISTALCEL